MIEILKKNGDDFELVQSCETEQDAVSALATLRADGGEYHAEIRNGSMAMTMVGV